MATNKDVTLKLNGVNVYPRTFDHNVYGADGRTLAQVISEIKGVQDSNASLISDHGKQLASQASQILALQQADVELRGRVESLEGSRDNHEGRISTLENNAGALENRVKVIEGVIPSNASETNKLAAESYVNDAINQIGAYYITNSNGEAFATKEEFDAAVASGELYSGGEVRIPQRNDYALVLEDESRGKTDADETYPTTRYIFDEQWEFQYVVNNTTLKQSQLDAINSGITAELVAKIDANEDRLDAIDGEEGRLATIESTAAALAQTVADNKTAVDERIDGIDERIDNIVNSNLGGLDKEIAEINADITALQQELNGVEGTETVGIKERLTTAEGDIDALEGRADAVEGRMNTAEADIDAAEGRLDAIEAAINGTPAVEGESDGTIGIIGRLDGHDTAIEELRTAIDEKQADLTAGQYVTITEDANGSQVIDIIVDGELSLDSTNPVSNNVITAELNKKVECTEEVEIETSIEYATMENRVAALEATIAGLVNEIAYLKSLHNGSVTPEKPENNAPTQAPNNVQTTSTDISFDEVPGATGYNAYVDGNHVGSF